MVKKEDPILQIIEKSGNGFHLRTAMYLKSLGWDITIGQYYADPVTDKPREIDILAKKNFPIADSGKHILVELFIECKYVSEENVIWFTEKDFKKAKNLVRNNNMMRDCEDHQLSTIVGLYQKQHHYIKPNQVGKLTAKEKGSDIFFDGINSCLHSLISLEGRTYENYHLEYPVIILNSFDKIYEVTENPNEPYIKIQDNFQLEINYSYMSKENRQLSKYFLVDVISFNSLKSFLDEIRNVDISIAAGLALTQIKKAGNIIINQMFGRDDYQ